MTLTKEQVKNYLATPDHCPKCGCEQIEGRGWDDDHSSQTIGCLNLACEFEWDDVYVLTNIDWAEGQFDEASPEEVKE